MRYIVGHSTSRSGKIVGVAGTPSKPKAPIPSVAKSQFRTPKRGTKLQKGSKVEKRKYAINTRGEKRGLKAAKLIRQRLSPVKKKSASKRKSRVSRSKPRKKVMRKRRVKRK